MKRVVFLLIFLFFAFSSVASATPWNQSAKEIASNYWKERRPDLPYCSPEQVTFIKINHYHPKWWARAPIGGCQRALEAGENAFIKVTNEPKHSGWKSYCTLIIHEWGHLLSLYHEKAPGSIMNHWITRKNIQYRACGETP